MTKAELLAAADALEWVITEPMPGLTKIRERITELRAQAAAGASMNEPVALFTQTDYDAERWTALMLLWGLGEVTLTTDDAGMFVVDFDSAESADRTWKGKGPEECLAEVIESFTSEHWDFDALPSQWAAATAVASRESGPLSASLPYPTHSRLRFPDIPHIAAAHPAPAPAEPMEQTAYLWWCAKCAKEIPFSEPNGEVSLNPNTHTVCGNSLELVKRNPAPAPASMTESVAWEHLKPFGYAPGNYTGHCHDCGKEWIDQDKRAWTCRACAEKKYAIVHPAPAPADHPLFGKMEQLGQPFEKVLHGNLDALQEAEQPAPAPADDLEVRLGEMRESNGRITWVVTLARPGNGVFGNYEIYSDSIKGRAEYEAARLKHFLGQGPRPDLLAFDTDAPAEHTAAGLSSDRTAIDDAKAPAAGVPDVAGLIDDLRSRINPQYADQKGTESYERKQCADALAALQSQVFDLKGSLDTSRLCTHERGRKVAQQAERIAALQSQLNARIAHGWIADAAGKQQDDKITQQAERITTLQTENECLAASCRAATENNDTLKTKLAEAVGLLASCVHRDGVMGTELEEKINALRDKAREVMG